jgi:hypothetical protein
MCLLCISVKSFLDHPTGHRPETENEKTLFPVGWKAVFCGLSFYYFVLLFDFKAVNAASPTFVNR